MQNLFNVIDKIRIQTADCQISIATCNQQAIIALELLSHYMNIWSKVPSALITDPDRMLRENTERVMTLTKAMYVLSISGMEFSARNAILTFRKIPPQSGRVHLRKILAESAKAGLIDSETANRWEGIIEVRNMIVHNNGISDISKTYFYPNGPTISLNAGRMTRGNLMIFAELTLWTVQAYSDWCQALLN
jgi:hypothetical protein